MAAARLQLVIFCDVFVHISTIRYLIFYSVSLAFLGMFLRQNTVALLKTSCMAGGRHDMPRPSPSPVDVRNKKSRMLTNSRDAVRGQSKSPNISFHMFGIVSY